MPSVPTPIVQDLATPFPESNTVAQAPSEPEPTPALGKAERRALAGLLCGRLTLQQQIKAGCDEGETARGSYAPLYDATPLEDQRLFDAQYYNALAKIGGPGSDLERRLAPQGGPKAMFEGIAVADKIDNTSLLPIRPFGTADHEQVLSGQSPSWEQDVRRAHGRN